jgi:hypothetical protein
MVADWNKWSPDEMAMQLVMSLQGEALILLSEMPLEIQNNYDSLVEELTRRFNPVEREAAHRVEFRNRLRNSNESAMQYGYALKRLAVKAFPTLTLSAQEQWIMDQFVAGLENVDLKKHVQFGHPRTLNEAISLAVEYDASDSHCKDKIKKLVHGDVSKIKAPAKVKSKMTQVCPNPEIRVKLGVLIVEKWDITSVNAPSHLPLRTMDRGPDLRDKVRDRDLDTRDSGLGTMDKTRGTGPDNREQRLAYKDRLRDLDMVRD